jgi:hypothetical protein
VWRAAGATVSAAALVAFVGAAVAWGPGLVGDPSRADAAAAHRSAAVAVPPGDQVLVCPGPARLADGSSGGDPQFKASPVGTSTRLQALVLAGGKGSLSTTAGGAPTPLAPAPGGSGASVLARDAVDGPLVVRVPPPGSNPSKSSSAQAPRAAASVASTTAAGDLRGLAGASCVAPAGDQWLVGGDTKVGDSTQLVLENAGLTAATVNVTAYGENGKVALGSSASLLVPAGKQVVRLLESAAAGHERLVVDVRASGGVVGAYLQHSALDGIVPQGVDFVSPGAVPGSHVAVAGVVSRGEAIADEHAPQLRLLAPDHDATATVSVWGPDGEVPLRGAQQQKLSAGAVVDVGLGGLPAGTYTVTVDADAPVVAGVLERRPAAAPTTAKPRPAWDLAWSPGQALGGHGTGKTPPDAGALALPPGAASALSLTAVPADRSPDAKPAGSVTATVRLVDATGRQVAAKAVTVPAGTTTTLDPRTLAPGKQVVGASVDGVSGADGASLAWGAVVAQGAPAPGVPGPANGQLVSVLAPVVSASAAGTVTVVADPTTGLG